MRKLFSHHINKLSPKYYWKELIAVLILLLAFVFFRSERKELAAIIPQLEQAEPQWLLAGLLVTLSYILLQGWMYIQSFKAIGLQINLKDAVELFLKRNLLSVFLPAGGISSLAYTTTQLRKRKLNTTQIHQAGALYGYIGILTVFLIGVPIIIYTVMNNRNFDNAWISLVILGLILAICLAFVWSFRSKNKFYQWFLLKFPSISANIDEIFAGELIKKHLYATIAISTLIECCGIVHAFISMYALGLPVSFEAAAVAYTITVVLMLVSPFLRGLGAVEFTMLYILKSYGYTQAAALSITIIYRAFEFWLPLLLGILSFIWRGRQIMSRLIPAIGIFFLGIVNLVSVATPPLADRMRLEHYYIPAEAMHASKLMVLVFGIGLIVTAAYLIKGYRSAFWLAIIFCAFSMFGHLIKAFDYEEALIALITFVLLLANYRQYPIQSNVKQVFFGFASFILVFISVCIFDFVSFYFIDKQHFGVDFSWQESIYHTARSFLLFSDPELNPLTSFGKEFLNITQFLGLASWFLLIYTLISPRKFKEVSPDAERAQQLLNLYGNSPMDYFKLMEDKQLYFSKISDGFTAYRVSGSFAVVLDEPVCALADKEEQIQEFDRYCYTLGLKSVYYRVEENSLLFFENMKKQKLCIGQEALMDVDVFSLEGKDRKSLRNGLNSLAKKGFQTQYMQAPQTADTLHALAAVSDNWLSSFDKKEMIFSQGMFDIEQLKSQDILVLKDDTGNILAFLNIIPDYVKEECTYDLIRKHEDAPAAAMDALIVELVAYAKDHHFKYINLGMVPLTGLDIPDNPAERIMKFAAKTVGSFKHYQSLRDFKEKYATLWENKYLVFDHDFDLLQLPQALGKVMKPNP